MDKKMYEYYIKECKYAMFLLVGTIVSLMIVGEILNIDLITAFGVLIIGSYIVRKRAIEKTEDNFQRKWGDL